MQVDKSRKQVNFIIDLTSKYIILLGILFFTAVVFFFIFFKPTKVVSTPNLEGKQLAEAIMLLQEKRLSVKLHQQYTQDPSDIGKVISQSPRAGVTIREKRMVNVTVSKGVIVSEVPDLVGFTLERAQETIQSNYAGFDSLLKIESIIKEFSVQTLGMVLAQTPKAGSKISNAGTKLELIVSRGDKNGDTVVDMTGLYFSEVFRYLEDKKIQFDFELSNNQVLPTEMHNYYLPAGVIIEQSHIANKIDEKDLVLRLGVRPRLFTQDEYINNKEKEREQKSRTIEIAEIPLKKQIGSITIYRIFGETEQKLMTVYKYEDKITFPYVKSSRVSFKAVDENNSNIWIYTIKDNQ